MGGAPLRSQSSFDPAAAPLPTLLGSAPLQPVHAPVHAPAPAGYAPAGYAASPYGQPAHLGMTSQPQPVNLAQPAYGYAAQPAVAYAQPVDSSEAAKMHVASAPVQMDHGAMMVLGQPPSYQMPDHPIVGLVPVQLAGTGYAQPGMMPAGLNQHQQALWLQAQQQHAQATQLQNQTAGARITNFVDGIIS